MAFTDVISQPPYPGAKREEIAELFVQDRIYSDWETIFVQIRWRDGVFPIFRFTAVEPQDSQSGTQTTLDLVAGWLLNDKGIVAPNSQLPPPGKAQSTPDQPAVTGDLTKQNKSNP